MNATLEGPDQWHIKGEFSFSILWWDKSVSFEERWGEVESADAGTASLAAILTAELDEPRQPRGRGPGRRRRTGHVGPGHRNQDVGPPARSAGRPPGRRALRPRDRPARNQADRRRSDHGPHRDGGPQRGGGRRLRVDDPTLRPRPVRGVDRRREAHRQGVRAVPVRCRRRCTGLRDARRAGPRRDHQVRDGAARSRAEGRALEVVARSPGGDDTRLRDDGRRCRSSGPRRARSAPSASAGWRRRWRPRRSL